MQTERQATANPQTKPIGVFQTHSRTHIQKLTTKSLYDNALKIMKYVTNVTNFLSSKNVYLIFVHVVCSIANLAIPDNTYNWLVQFFQGHSHCTKFGNQTSALREITASIVQGSAIGPASYVVTSCDLTAITAGNRVCNYADDTYVIIPACNSHSRLAELDHIGTWAGHKTYILTASNL